MQSHLASLLTRLIRSLKSLKSGLVTALQEYSTRLTSEDSLFTNVLTKQAVTLFLILAVIYGILFIVDLWLLIQHIKILALLIILIELILLFTIGLLVFLVL